MYRDRVQWTKIRRRILEDRTPIRQVVRETGISQKTIRKMLANRWPRNNMDRDVPETRRRRAQHLPAKQSATPPNRISVRRLRILLSTGCDPSSKTRLL